MSYDLVEIAGRVQRLERDNRRLKLGAGALVALVVAVPLVGAVLPPQNPFRQQQQEVIEARAFRVLDEQGGDRAALGPAGLSFFDEQGTLRVALGADSLAFYDEQGTLRSGLDAEWLKLYDEQGKVSAGLSAVWLDLGNEQGDRAFLSAGSLDFLVEEKARLRLGRVTVINQRTDAETSYPAALVLFDEEGNVIERLPR